MTQFISANRSRLEQIWKQPTTKRTALTEKAQTPNAIQTLLVALSNFFTNSQQIRIWTKSTKRGVVWFAYDPSSDQRIGHCSEDELRVWLEARHYQ